MVRQLYTTGWKSAGGDLLLALCLSAKDYKVTAKDYKVTTIETVVNAERDSVLVKNHALCPVNLKAGTK